jgi:hypothetical protein
LAAKQTNSRKFGLQARSQECIPRTSAEVRCPLSPTKQSVAVVAAFCLEDKVFESSAYTNKVSFVFLSLKMISIAGEFYSALIISNLRLILVTK